MKINPKISTPKDLTTMPDVTKSPAGPSPIPIPYPNLLDKNLGVKSDKQAKQVLQGRTAEQDIATQQLKSQIGKLADAKLPKALRFLESDPPKALTNLPKNIQAELSSIGKSLDPANLKSSQAKLGSAISETMKLQKGAVDPNTLVQHVLRESYMEQQKDLRAFADKVKHYNEIKKAIRDELRDLREQKANLKKTDPHKLDSKIKKLEEKLNQVGDDAQLANVDLQNILQKRQQTLQMLSNISKMLYDTASSVIRKMGG